MTHARSGLVPAYFLALGTFAIGTEGFMIAPLLPVISGDLGMSLPATAMLVVVFTLVLALSSPITTVLSARLRARDVLVLAMALFVGGNLLAAFSPGFATLMAARIIMAIAAGLFAPNASALAGSLAGAEQRGRALAVVSGGMTIAIALGLPFGALIGHAFGWRTTFVFVAFMGAVAVVGILAGIRQKSGDERRVGTLADRLGVVRQTQILRLLGVTLLWSVGAYTAYPYLAPYLTQTLGYGDLAIMTTVSMWGVFAALGVVAGGILSDRFGPPRVVSVSLVALGLSFAALAISTALPRSAAILPVIGAIAVWGFSVWSFFPAQMARLIAAGPAPQAPIALSLNTSTMYLGFSIGSFMGAGIVGLNSIWMIGVVAALAEAIALVLNKAILAPTSGQTR